MGSQCVWCRTQCARRLVTCGRTGGTDGGGDSTGCSRVLLGPCGRRTLHVGRYTTTTRVDARKCVLRTIQGRVSTSSASKIIGGPRDTLLVRRGPDYSVSPTLGQTVGGDVRSTIRGFSRSRCSGLHCRFSGLIFRAFVGRTEGPGGPLLSSGGDRRPVGRGSRMGRYRTRSLL